MAADAKRESRASHEFFGLAAILAIGVAVRAFAWSRTAVIFNDGPIFLAMAEAIGEGRWAEVLSHPYHPLYPALIALFSVFPIDIETAAIMVSIFGGLLSIIAVFWFVQDAFDDEIAWLAAWVVTLHPWAVDFSSDVMSDGLYSGFFLLGFAAMARAVDRLDVKYAAACGTFSGIAYLVRPEGAGLMVACTLLLVGRGLLDRSQRGRVARASAALLLAGAVVAMPFVVAVGQQTGDFVLTQKKSISSLVGASSHAGMPAHEKPGSQLTDRSIVPLPLPESAVRSDGPGAVRPARNWRGLLEAVIRVGGTSMAAFRFELLAFAFVGIWALRSDRKPWRAWTLGLPIALYSGLLVLLVWGVGYISRRHALAPWLPAVGLSALGWRFLCRELADHATRRGQSWSAHWRAPRSVALVLVTTLVIGWGARDLRPRRFDRAPVRAAAEWLALHHPKSGRVAAQKLRTAYYAGAEFVPLPPGHDGLLESHLRHRGTRWVVMDESKLEDHRGLEEGIDRWLHRVHVVKSEGRNILVLAVSAEPAS